MTALLTLCLLAADPQAAAPPQTYELKHRFVEGETLVYTVAQKSAIDMRSAEVEDQVVHSSETTRHAVVDRVKPDGSGVVTLSNTHARLMATAPGEEPVTYDSASDADVPPQFEGVRGSIGKPLMTMTVSPAGEVVRVENLERVQTDVEAANRSNLQPFVPLPAGPVEIGEKWKDVYQVTIRAEDGFPLPVKMQRTFTLRAVREGVATIDWRSVVRTPLNDPKLESQLVSRELAGELTFDIGAGRVTSRTARGDRTVVGFAGAGTSMRTVTDRKESLVQTLAAGETATPR